jgi:hypothetical protein
LLGHGKGSMVSTAHAMLNTLNNRDGKWKGIER